MRTVRGLFPTLIDPDFLDACVDLSARGKRRRPDVARFLFLREREVAAIGEALRDGSWRPGGFELLFVHDPKPRAIAKAPFADRVVHRALAILLERAFGPSYTPSSHACRPGMGTHRALLALAAAMRRRRWFLHLDVRSYFPSIDPDLALALVARRVRDERFLGVLGRVLEAGRGLYDSPAVRLFARIDPDWPPRGRGLPIGASTSQLLASQVFLLELDQAIRRRLRVPDYVRYVDDQFLLHDDRRALREARAWIADWLWEARGLRLKRPKASVRSTQEALHGLGHRIDRGGVEALARSRRALRAALARHAWEPVYGLAGRGRRRDLRAGVGSRIGGIGFP